MAPQVLPALAIRQHSTLDHEDGHPTQNSQSSTKRPGTLEQFPRTADAETEADALGATSLAATRKLGPARTGGPPGMKDMIHLRGSSQRLGRTLEAVRACFEPLGLAWEKHAANVYPVPDFFYKHIVSNGHMRNVILVRNRTMPQVREALEDLLHSWPLHRSVVVEPEPGEYLFIEIKPGSHWSKHSILELPGTVASAVELKALASASLPDADVRAGVPLFRTTIIPCGTSDTGLIVTCHHATYDATSILNWMDDFDKTLRPSQERSVRIPYKPFADAHYNGRYSVLAMTSAACLAPMYQGLGNNPAVVWPPANCRRLKDAIDKASGPVETVHKTDFPRMQQPQWTGVYTQRRELPFLPTLKSRGGTPPELILQTALALLVVKETGESIALFGTLYAAREWPFLPKDVALSAALPDPRAIAGPTLSSVCRVVHVDRNATVASLIEESKKDAQLLCQNARALPARLREQLDENDFKVVEAGNRLRFNWRGRMGMRLYSDNKDKLVWPIQLDRYVPVEVGFQPCLASPSAVDLEVIFNPVTYSMEEIKSYTQQMLDIAEWIHRPENFAKSVQECFLAMQQMSDQSGSGRPSDATTG